MKTIEQIEQSADKVELDVKAEIKHAYITADRLIDTLINLGKVAEADTVKQIRDSLGWKPKSFMA